MRRISTALAGAALVAATGSLGSDLTGLSIDIRPGSDSNNVDVRSAEPIPVAILGSESYSLAGIDLHSLSFGPRGAGLASMPTSADLTDVNFDGHLDLVVRFVTKDTGIARGDKQACLTGASATGNPFTACDSVTTTRSRGKKRR